MDGKICDQVIFIFIDPQSNYIYASPDLVDKCGLTNELHVESWSSAVGYRYKEESS